MPEPENKEGNLPDPVMDVLKEIQEKVDKLPKGDEKPEVTTPSAPTYADRRVELQKSLGYTDQQMAAHEEMIMRANAPVIERTAWSHIEKRPDIETYRKEIEAELAIYPQERRTPDILEKVYYMVRGKHADSKPAAPAAKGGSREDVRVSRGPGYTGAEPGLAGGSDEKGGEGEELDDKEKYVVSKLREGGIEITEKDYAKSRNAGRNIRELRVPDQRQATSMADLELRRLTRSR